MQKNVTLLEKKSTTKLKILQRRQLMHGLEDLKTLAAKIEYHRLLEQIEEAKWKEAATRLAEARATGKETAQIASEMQHAEERRKTEAHIHEMAIKRFKQNAKA